MNDNEITKALEHCLNREQVPRCIKCEYVTGCKPLLMREALDLINRQRAEIEDLREIVFTDRSEAIKNLKAEAIKEFAERLKEVPIKCGLPLFGLSTKGEIEAYFNSIMCDVGKAIDNLVKEMTDTDVP